MVLVLLLAMMVLRNYIKNMLEALRHITGLCGEAHPSLITLLLGTPFATYILFKIKNKRR